MEPKPPLRSICIGAPFLLLLLTLTPLPASAYNFGVDSAQAACAVLYSEQNFTGNQLPILNDKIFPDLKESYTNSIGKNSETRLLTWGNFTSSVRVVKGCALTVWSGEYWGGITKGYVKDQASLGLVSLIYLRVILISC
jgi:hypothetical protein